MQYMQLLYKLCIQLLCKSCKVCFTHEWS